MLFAGNTFAEPMYYTFQGPITWITDPTEWDEDAPDLIGDLEIGDIVSYTVEIDLERVGTVTPHGGTPEPVDGTFYADLIQGSYLPPSGSTYGYAEQNYYDTTYGFGLQLDSSADWVSIWDGFPFPDLPITEWLENIDLFTVDSFGGHEYFGYSSWPDIPEMYAIGFDLDLVSIVVPVPGAVILGILGLGTAGWRLRKKKDA
jgi:hypothetical protein